MSKDIGQDYGLYLADSAPTDTSNTTGYNLVGFATEHSINIDRDLVEAANKDSGGDMEYVVGRRTTTIEGTFYLETAHADDPGQDDIFTEIQRDTTDTLYFLLSDNVSNHVQFVGEALTESAEVTMGDQEMIELSVTLQVQGSVTIESAP